MSRNQETFNIFIVLPHLKCGGTERSAAELANFIAKNGGTVSLVLMYRREIFYDIVPDVKIYEPGNIADDTPGIIKLIKILHFIRSTIKNNNPDVVIALGYIAFTLCASIGLRTKVIMSYRSNPNRIRFPNNRLMNFLYNLSHFFLRGRVDGIIAQTNAAANIYKERYSCPVVSIPNFLRNITDYGIEKENFIINVGHFTTDKAQHYLIRAFSLLNAPDWNLLLIGQGPQYESLKELCKELNVESRVIFKGYQKDLDRYLAMSKIFAFSSVVEGYPNALLEAMAIPLPSVSFSCDFGPSEIIIDGKNGFLVKVGDIETFASKLQELVDKPSLRDTIQSEAYKIREENNVNVIAPLYIDFFLFVSKMSPLSSSSLRFVKDCNGYLA